MYGGGRGFHGGGGNMTDEEKKNLPKITWPLVKRVLGYITPYWAWMILILGTIVVSSVLGIMPAILTGRIIDDGFYAGDFNMLMQLVGLSFVVVIGSNLVMVLQSYASTWVSQQIVYDMRNQMYKHLTFMSHRFFTSEKPGQVITRMTTDISGVQSVISGTMTSIFSNIITLATTLIAIYSTDWVLATVGVIIIPILIIPSKKVGKARFNLAITAGKKQDEMNQILNETLSVSGSLLVKIFSKEKDECEKYRVVNKDVTALAVKESLVGRWFRMVMGVVTNIGPMLIYLVAGILMFRIGNSTLTVGDVTVMVTLINRLYGPVNSLFNIQIDVTRSLALFKRIFDYYDLPIEIANKEKPTAVPDIKGEIEFENVSFHYNEETPILKGVNFGVKPGKTLAIVGPSGAGKSTIIGLIPRLYDAVSGSVKVDGVDIKDMDVHKLRDSIGFVTQDTYMFNGTVKENLLYAREDATDDEIIDACKRANIHDFIEGLPNGYDSVVGNRGLKLSGGEKQRISIARVMLKNPSILLLDEATSSLDSISESLIQNALDPLLEGRTSVVIAHRLSTIMKADEILVVENGNVVERGVHDKLLANGGIYKELFETQFRKAIDYAIEHGA